MCTLGHASLDSCACAVCPRRGQTRSRVREALKCSLREVPGETPCSHSSPCPRALVRSTSSVACRVGTWLWPWVVLIVLTKTKRDAANCWTSRLESEYAADPWVQDQIQRKLTLERFQKENPGFDFSGAEISGNHTNGGPDFSNLEK